ncbi:Magnesium transporter [Musa troglodytarum]|uniref:Magnesium transporter n=1 Tax=Musa troglodytarum TaxID=320322 RepID=A0A9E7LEC0_9LILI|nr:Magnesium transporter [Musa troglodytarum]
MAELRERLLPRKPSVAGVLPSTTARESPSGCRPLFQGVDFSELKKRGQSLRSWIRVDAATGGSQVIEVDKFTMMRRCDLPARDLRLLDPIRCIITADEVLLLNSFDGYVLQYVAELQRRLVAGTRDALDGGTPSPDFLPFEFRALEVALEAACTFLDAQVRDEIEQLMDDDGDMAEMYLTAKKMHMDSSLDGDQSLHGSSSAGDGVSVSSPVSPVSSPPESRKLEKTLSLSRSRYESTKCSDSTTENIEELEMLLEAYFVVIDSTLNKLTSLKEYIDDTEDFINIQLVISPFT